MTNGTICTRDPKSYTRNQACRAIARSFDVDAISGFLTHANKHASGYASRKIASLLQANAAPVEVHLPILAEPPCEVPVEAEVSAMFTQLDKDKAALAEAYGETIADVEAILAAKDGDLSATRRSLISRKSARTRKASARK